jgi:hypothetical protein
MRGQELGLDTGYPRIRLRPVSGDYGEASEWQ